MSYWFFNHMRASCAVLAAVWCWAAVPGQAAELSLTVSVPSVDAEGGTTQNRLRLGVGAGTTDGFDIGQDTPAFTPELSSVLTATVVHRDYPSDKQRLWWDFRSEQFPQRWEIEVASLTREVITLTWEAPPTVASACVPVRWTLEDQVERQTIILLDDAGPYRYPNQPGAVRRFIVSATPSDPVNPPAAPSNVWSPRQGRTSVYLAWSASTDSSLRYHLYRETATGWRRLTAVALSATTYLDTGLDPSQAATYRVTAVDAHGCESTHSSGVVLSPRR